MADRRPVLRISPRRHILAVAERLRPLILQRGLTALMLIAIGVAIWVLVGEGAQLLAQPIRLDFFLVGLSFLVECSGLLIAIPVWRRILACYGIRQSARDDVRIYCYSALGTTLPGGIWAIVGRSGFYQRQGASSLSVATASVVEAFVIGIGALGVYAVCTIIRPEISLMQRPEIGIGFAAFVLVLIHPRVFNRLSGWVFDRARVAPVLRVDFSLGELACWIGFEAAVIVIGGLALFVLLSGLLIVPLSVVMATIAAWAAACAISSLFFWLPGTPFLRDGAMVIALTPTLSMPMAIVFVILVRVWSLASLLIVAGIIWLLLDRPQLMVRLENRARNKKR